MQGQNKQHLGIKLCLWLHQQTDEELRQSLKYPERHNAEVCMATCNRFATESRDKMDIECFTLEIARVLSALLRYVQLRSKAQSCHHAKIFQNIHTLLKTWQKGKTSSIIPNMILDYPRVRPYYPGQPINPSWQRMDRQFRELHHGWQSILPRCKHKGCEPLTEAASGPRWSGVEACYLSAIENSTQMHLMPLGRLNISKRLSVKFFLCEADSASSHLADCWLQFI